MTVLVFMLILCLDLVIGMDNLSVGSDLNNENELDLTEYTKQELDIDNLDHYSKIILYDQKYLFHENNFVQDRTEEKVGVKKLITDSQENFDETNKLKRKHKLDKEVKILGCEFCQEESKKYRKSKFSNKSLCNTCYKYESRHGHLIPRAERNRAIHRNILGCEFCQKESTNYTRGKVSGKSLCKPCYDYEAQHGHLVPLDQRKILEKHKDCILVCECCQKDKNNYIKGKFSGKSLCDTCYQNERRHGHSQFYDKQITHDHEKHKDILVCELCQQVSKRYKKGKVSGKSLCPGCYQYEYRHFREQKDKNNEEFTRGQLIRPDERTIQACEFCQRVSTRYTKSKTNGTSLCIACYTYENRHGHLLARDERKKPKYSILGCEVCQKASIKYRISKLSGKLLCRACYNCEY